MVTYHRYPLRACTTDPIAARASRRSRNLLADSSSAGLAAGARPVRGRRPRHAAAVPARRDELGLLPGRRPGSATRFASALWVLDTLFNLAGVGVDGVNFHTLPGSAYELFTLSQTPSGAWQAVVHPEYYGLLMFAQAFPAGARLLPVTAPGRAGQGLGDRRPPTAASASSLINKDPTAGTTVAGRSSPAPTTPATSRR